MTLREWWPRHDMVTYNIYSYQIQLQYDYEYNAIQCNAMRCNTIQYDTVAVNASFRAKMCVIISMTYLGHWPRKV